MMAERDEEKGLSERVTKLEIRLIAATERFSEALENAKGCFADNRKTHDDIVKKIDDHAREERDMMADYVKAVFKGQLALIGTTALGAIALVSSTIGTVVYLLNKHEDHLHTIEKALSIN